jgi:aspartate/tyrosine/aromatic aminotransferase
MCVCVRTHVHSVYAHQVYNRPLSTCVCRASGLECREYTYYNPNTFSFDCEGACKDLEVSCWRDELVALGHPLTCVLDRLCTLWEVFTFAML